MLEEALRSLDEPDGDLGVALEGELMAMGFHEFTSTELAAPYWDRRLVRLEAGEELNPTTLACLVVAIAASRGPAAAALRLANRVLDARWLGEPNSVVGGLLGNGLIYAGAPSRAGRFYHETIATATRRGSRLTVAWQSVMRSDASLRLGEIRRAEAEARAGLELFEEGSGVEAFVWGTAHLLNALVARGALEEGDELLGRGIVGASAAPTLPLGLFLAALSLAALDRGAEARALAEDELADARRFATPDAEGAALRTVGLVAGGAEGVEALRASVSAPRRRMSCARRSTRRRARERADWPIARTGSWSPRALARAAIGGCCRGGSR